MATVVALGFSLIILAVFSGILLSEKRRNRAQREQEDRNEPAPLSAEQVERLTRALTNMEASLQRLPAQAVTRQEPVWGPATVGDLTDLIANLSRAANRTQLPEAVQQQFGRLEEIMRERFQGFDQLMEDAMSRMNTGASNSDGMWRVITTTTTTRPRRQARPRAPSEPTVPDRPQPNVWQRLTEPSWLNETTETPTKPTSPTPSSTPKTSSAPKT